MYKAKKTFEVPGFPKFIEDECYSKIPDKRMISRGLFVKVKQKEVTEEGKETSVVKKLKRTPNQKAQKEEELV